MVIQEILALLETQEILELGKLAVLVVKVVEWFLLLRKQ
jgi:hypothetical protein